VVTFSIHLLFYCRSYSSKTAWLICALWRTDPSWQIYIVSCGVRWFPFMYVVCLLFCIIVTYRQMKDMYIPFLCFLEGLKDTTQKPWVP